ncbi:hypothetical protein Tco_0819814 [Tanacetum coccineum]|uniref:Reverse transcriptase Ty1/copia-type domain-containing protein n=1 Tax=Tanacetum coccineum TaxID=301880 RepID=A0ABQ5A7M5_9ASTR
MKTPMSSDIKLTKDEEYQSVDSTKYRSIIGSLLYLTASRPDIMFNVCLCARFQEDPKTSHLEAIQTALAISTTKAEYVIARKASQQALWIKQALIDYDIRLDDVLIMSMFEHIQFDCLLEINEQICSRFILEFYSQYRINYDSKGKMFVEFFFQNQLFSFSLEEFGQILGIPYKGDCSFSDKWSFDDLQYSVLTGGPFQTNPPSPDDIKFYVQIEREDVVTHICHDQEIAVEDDQILTREITDVMKTWVDIIRENVFCLGGNQDHVIACPCHMLYCIATFTQYNLTYFIAKRMEFVTKQARLILPYGMLLTRLFNYVMSKNPELSKSLYVLYDYVMYPLAAQQERKTQKDYGMRRGRSSTSSSSAFDQPSSSHPNYDDNDGNDEGTSHASTHSPTCFVNLLTNEVPQVFSNPPNIDPNMEPFYTRQTEILNRQVQL